ELVAHGADGLGSGADEPQTLLLHAPGEAGVLREEPVAGVHGVRTGAQGSREQEVLPKVGVRRAGGADAHRPVGEPHGGRLPVGVGVGDDGLDPERVAGPDDADRDLTPVRDENPADHGCSGLIRRSGWPNSTNPSFSASTSTTVPAAGAVTPLNIF